MKQPILFLISLQFLFLFQIIKKVGFLIPTFFLYVNFQRELLTTKSRELHKITEKVSYLLRSLVLKPLFFLASPQQPLLDKTCVYTATFICILYLKRTTIQNSEYFTRLLFTSLNSIYSVANVLNILYTKTSKIANFSATFSMLVLFIPYEYMSHG